MRSLFALGVVLSVGGAAYAGSITANYASVNPSANATVSFNGGVSSMTIPVGLMHYDSTDLSGATGGGPGDPSDFMLVQSIGWNGATASFWSFCIEGLQYVDGADQSNFNLGVIYLKDAPNPGTPIPGMAGMGVSRANAISELFNENYGTPSMLMNSSTDMAAFQLAVWELVYDGPGSINLSGGSFRAAAGLSVINKANAYLLALDGTYTSNYEILALSSDVSASKYQDQMIAVQGFGNVVPVPAALPAGLALLGGLACFRMVRRK